VRLGWRAIFVAAILSASTVASAGPYSQLIVFGDSLSDVGNIASSSFGIYPGPYYWNNRFSNGPVYVESLDTGLGLPPIARSTAGGNDFAYGGAQTSGTGGLDGIFIKDLDEQVSQFLSAGRADSKALYLVFAGANDFINGQTSVSVPVSNIQTQLNKLAVAGARQFFVANLPLLGYTPKFNTSPTMFTQYNSLSAQFNTSLGTMLDQLQSSNAANAALTIHRLDVASLFSQAIANPAAFGLTDVTHSAAPGLTSGTSSYNTSQIAPNANQYLFWDDVHPTATVHAELAQYALVQLMLPGDVNRDGFINIADVSALEGALTDLSKYQSSNNLTSTQLTSIDNLNSDNLVTNTDLQGLIDLLANGGGTGGGALNAVPEPSAMVLSVLAALASTITLGHSMRPRIAREAWRHGAGNNHEGLEGREGGRRGWLRAAGCGGSWAAERS
jgi:phospholipase/lecithinase/hemolysin